MSEQEERERYYAERAAEDYEHDRQRAIALATAERAVIDAAVEWQRLRDDTDQPDDLYFGACDNLGAAIDALLAARGKP